MSRSSKGLTCQRDIKHRNSKGDNFNYFKEETFKVNQNEWMIRGLELKIDRILDYLQNQEANTKKVSSTDCNEGKWVTLTQAWAMQGKIVSLNTIRARLDLQPKCGHGEKYGRVKVFSIEDVNEWLAAVTPEQRAAYKAKYGKEVS